MKKLYNNKIILMLSSLALSSSLVSCTPKKQSENEQIKKEITYLVINKIDDKVKEVNNNLKNEREAIIQRQADKKIETYLTLLREDISTLELYAKETWNSGKVQDKYNYVKQKIKDLFNFIFNGKEINGITFKDLSTNGKEIAQNSLYELNYYIELMIPNYKDRLHDWSIDKGEEAVELWNSLENWYENYKEEVMDEYSTKTQKTSSYTFTKK